MISPMTAPRVLGESSTLGRGATPHEGMRELRLEVRLAGREGFIYIWNVVFVLGEVWICAH